MDVSWRRLCTPSPSRAWLASLLAAAPPMPILAASAFAAPEPRRSDIVLPSSEDRILDFARSFLVSSIDSSSFFLRAASSPSRSAPNFVPNSAKGIRLGKPERRIRTISRTPEYCSWRSTRACSKPNAAIPSFGLTHRM